MKIIKVFWICYKDFFRRNQANNPHISWSNRSTNCRQIKTLKKIIICLRFESLNNQIKAANEQYFTEKDDSVVCVGIFIIKF
jgi:patatin-like phospholipase/acyl hydrolase